MRILGLSFLLAAGAGIADAISIKTGKVIVKIDPTVHSSGRFAFPVLSNGRAAAAEIIEIPAANWVSAVVPVSSLADVETLQKTSGVIAVYENKVYKAPKKPTALKSNDDSVPDANVAHKITGVLEARKTFGVTGKGVKVGIVDSGVDWKHPALGGGTTFPTAKVAYGHDFAGDDYTGYNTPVEDNDPMDCGGHGTHVAGIVGANSTANYFFTGVAPDVTFGAYRVFGCSGSSDDSVIIKAIQRAFDDGMDIISMSLGSDSGFPSGLEVDLINQLSATGKVIFSIAQGNAQSDGVWQSSSPAIAEKAIAVAATSNFATTRIRGITVGGVKFNVTVYDNSPVDAAFSGEIILNTLAAPASGAASNSDGCTGTPNAVGVATNPAGKVLIVRRGTCTFVEKGQNAQAAGAVAVIIYNHGLSALPALGDLSADPSSGITIPVYSMEAASGSALADLLLKTSGSAKIAYDATDSSSALNPVNVATFTSWGPGPDLSFKPDVAAPGTNILSTLPLAQGGFGLESGTSMATPYNTGIIALYLQYAKIIAAGQTPGTTTTTTTSTVTVADTSSQAGGYSTIATSDASSSPAGGYSTIATGSASSTILGDVSSTTSAFSTPGGGYSTIAGDQSPTTTLSTTPLKCRPRPTSSVAPSPTPAYGRRMSRRDDTALLKELFSSDPIFVRSRLQNAGKQLTYSSFSFFDSALLQGGGLIQVPQLLGTRVFASPGKIPLGSWQTKQVHTFTIKNYDSVTQKVSISAINALSVQVTDSNNPGFYDDASEVLFSIGGSEPKATVEVELASGASTLVSVSLTPSSDTLGLAVANEIVLASGWISVTAAGYSNTIVFGGLVGDRRNAPITDQEPAWSVNGAETSDQVTTTIAALKSLGAVIRLIIPAGEIAVSLLDATTRKVIGTIPTLSGTEFPRNGNDATDSSYQWTLDWSSLEYLDSTTNTTKKLTAGSYIVSAKFTFVKAINEDTTPVSPKALEFPTLVLS
ncbi:hypothetical protein BJ742DRAFT_850028 [Cladochytrium replicatum]|nr:hypothetical protein BJ742DRAFT_850028 [Cladochytrium replicatum]